MLEGSEHPDDSLEEEEDSVDDCIVAEVAGARYHAFDKVRLYKMMAMAPKFELNVVQIHSQQIWLRREHTFKKLRVCDTFDF
jgi:hypothetical protein